MTFRLVVRRSLHVTALFAVAALAACSDAATSAPDLPDAAQAKQGALRVNTLTVTASGLPQGAAASIRVTSNGGYSATITGTTTLSGLSNGSYLISAANVSVGGTTYTPSPTSQSVNLKNGTSRSVSVVYSAVVTTGTLNVAIGGLDATPAAVTVSGPNGFSRTLTTSASLGALAPGSYTVNAQEVTTSTGVRYAVSPITQSVSVTAGVTSTASVSYTVSGVVPGTDFNVQILAATLIQSVQTLNNSVNLVAGRDAMVRVFPVANTVNTVKPAIRVRVFANGMLQTTLEATTTATSVPTSIDQSRMSMSWNVVIPGALVQPGLAIQAEVDPDRLIPEASDADNLFPATGAPLAASVRAVPPLNLTFVPVKVGTASAGNITTSNGNSFLVDTRDMLPMSTVNWTVRAPYTTSVSLLSDGTGWNTVLSELYSLRTADRASTHYYGVVKVGYTSGVAGMGYIGAPTAIGWDLLPSANGIMAHELGHNFGRYHAPCGGPSGPDPSFPYAGGQTGVFGFNVRTNTLWSNTVADFMGYCSPAWISDYNYSAIMNFRGFSASALLAAGTTAEQPSLLVWGRVDANGEIVLEPAMRIVAPKVLPTSGGEYDIAAYDDAGATVFSFDFTPVATSNDGVDGGAHFAFVVPVSDAAYERLARIEVMGGGRRAERVSRQPAAAALATANAARGLDIAAEAPARARLRWNQSAFPMIMVRDPETGQVLSFARNGDVAVATTRTELDVTVSDGVRSGSARVRVRGR